MNWWEKCKRSEPNIFKNGGLRVKKYIRLYASFPTYVPVHNYVYFDSATGGKCGPLIGRQLGASM